MGSLCRLWYRTLPASPSHSGHGWRLLFSLFLHSTNQMNGSIEMTPGRKDGYHVPVENSSDRSIMKQFSNRHCQIRSSHRQLPINKPIRQVAGGRGEAAEHQALRGASHRLDHKSAEGTSGVLRTERARPLSPLATPFTLQGGSRAGWFSSTPRTPSSAGSSRPSPTLTSSDPRIFRPPAEPQHRLRRNWTRLPPMAFKSKSSPKRNCVTQLHDYLNKYVTYDSDVCSYELISLSSSIPVKEFSISLLAAEI